MKQYFKKIILNWLPPVLIKSLNKICCQNIMFRGTFDSWAEALSESEGYSTNLILERVKEAALDVKLGKAVFERDAVRFYKKQYTLPLLTCLLRIAAKNKGSLSVIDFGGSLGSTYFQNQDMLSELQELSWHVVEQKNFVNCGKEYFENNQLKFFSSLNESVDLMKPDVIVLSSVLQYIEEPYKLINEIISKNIEYILIDRTPCHEEKNDVLTVQVVPSNIYKSSYPTWIFNSSKLIHEMGTYDMLYEFKSEDGIIRSAGHSAEYKGFFLKKHK